jgi:Ala-tRNA(Pro) deacylase
MNDAPAFFKLLEELGIASETVEHEAVFTAGGLARDLSQWEFPVKNAVLEDKNKQLYLVTMHLSSPQLDLKKLAEMLGAAGRFSFARAPSLAGTLNVLPGSVTPFAAFMDRERQVKIVLDARLKSAKTISAHPLVNTMTTTIAMQDFLRLLDFSGHNPVWRTLPFKREDKEPAG